MLSLAYDMACPDFHAFPFLFHSHGPALWATQPIQLMSTGSYLNQTLPVSMLCRILESDDE